MSETKETRKRNALGPLYAPEELVSKAVSIPEIAKGITGTDKVAAIIQCFDFYHQWKDKVSNLDNVSNPDDQARIAELERDLATEQENVRALSEDNDKYAAAATEKDQKISELEAKVANLEIASGETDSEKDKRIAELEAQVAALQSQQPTWPAIKATIDPVYAEMMEEVARELGQDDPLLMAIDIFAKYHILRYTELPFQPFIPEKVLNGIIESHYPELGGLRGLRKKLA